MTKYVAYYRVSTQKQGDSGYGLEAQQRDVETHLKDNKGTLLAEFTEIKSGRKNRRPEFSKALALCEKTGAILVAAKMDRISRRKAVLNQIRDSNIEIAICDMPSANSMMIGILAEIADYEAVQISDRTRKALKSAKINGKQIGNPHIGTKRDTHRQEASRAALADDRKAYGLQIVPEIKAMLDLTAMHDAPKQRVADLLNRTEEAITPREFVAELKGQKKPNVRWHRQTVYRLFKDYPELTVA